MTAPNLRAAATAFLLGTASIGATAILTAMPAAALTVSAKVGPLLTEAKQMINAKNYSGAKAKLNEAEAAASTADDRTVINSLKAALAVGSADPNTPAGAKAKFANDYNAGRYKDVIADADYLRKFNEFDAQSQLIVGQAYYKAQDYNGCVKYAKNLGGSDTALELQARCAYEIGDEATQRSALETLVSRSNKPEYWALLLKITERTKGLNDHNTLDIYRIRYLTGNITSKDDYQTLATMALQLHNFAEGQAYIEKGMASKVLTDDRSQRLLTLAKTQAAAASASLAKDTAAAQAAPQGDALVALGENMIGMGKAKDAIPLIQAGMKKPLKDANNAEMRLAQAYVAAGQKGDAAKAVSGIKAPPNDAAVAHLWTLYARK